MGLVRCEARESSSLEESLAHADYLMYQQKRAKAGREG
jgi:hypothetical protein